jgi:hypothetical protein
MNIDELMLSFGGKYFQLREVNLCYVKDVI